MDKYEILPPSKREEYKNAKIDDRKAIPSANLIH